MGLSAAAVMPTLPVTDLKRARRFYEDALGLKAIKEFEDASLYACGDTALYIYQRPPSRAEHTLASFVVDDLDATMKDLRRHGVKFEEYDSDGLKTIEGVAEIPEGRAAWFKDPDGNILGVTELADQTLFGGDARQSQDLKRRIRKYWRDLKSIDDLDMIDDYYAAKAKYHGPGGEEIVGSAALKAYVEKYFVAFPDMKVELKDARVDGDIVTSRWIATGTHKGELDGMPPTKKRIEISGVTINRWKNGKIVEEWEYPDMASLFAQLGVIET